MSWSQVPDGQIVVHSPFWNIFNERFFHVFDIVKPSVDVDSLQQYEGWTMDHGSE